MSIRKKMAAIAVAVAIATGGLLMATPQAAFAAYDCQVNHTVRGYAKAQCFKTSPGGDRYRIVWGCFNWWTGTYRAQYGNVARVSVEGSSSTIPACRWNEEPHGSRWVETLWD